MSTPVRLGVDWTRAPDVLACWSSHVLPTDVLQLTVEQAFRSDLPEAWTGPLDEAAARGDVVAHAVMGSPYSRRSPFTEDWLQRTAAVLQRWPARWLVDHVGCSRANGRIAAPLPLPGSSALIQRVVDHLSWVQDRLQIPVGLENLALAVSRDDVLLQPELVDHMLDPVDGVLLLDVHNLWCQAINFGFQPVALLERWPLDRVRQIHISGGSWVDGLRRDTHDGPVPDEVFALLLEAVSRCPALEVVVLERIGGSADPDLPDDLSRLRALTMPAATSVPRTAPAVGMRTEGPTVQHALYAALDRDDRAAVEVLAPGWWVDDRTWGAARELLRKWGRALPA